MKAILDRYSEKFVSRKFLTFLTATGLCINGNVTSDNWAAVAMLYVGSQALVDLAIKWKHGSN